MLNIKPIKKSPAISEQVADQIQDLISNSHLGPGDQLPTQEFMAKRMNVSRTSVRESLKTLEAKGFIEQRQNGRYIVAGITSTHLVDPLGTIVARHPERIWEVLETAKVLVAQAARLAAQRATDEQIDSLGKLVSKLEMAKDDKKYFRAHFDSIYYDFYRTLVAATQNIVFSHLTYSLDEIFSAAFPYPRQALVNVPRISTVIYLQHRDIWKAIAARNPQAASKSVNKHFDYIESKLRELAEGLDDVQDERP